jgi:exopolysaccharide biosynthesis polyprenyl glycosylphosphotransferase
VYDDRSMELDRTVFLLDVLVSIAVFALSFEIRDFLRPDGEISLFTHFFLLPLLLVLVVSFLSYFGAYALPKYTSNVKYAWSVLRGVALAIGILLTLLFFFNIQYISRAVIFTFAGLEFLALFSIRIAVKNYFFRSVASGRNTLKVLIIGTGERAKDLVKEIEEQADWGVEIVGYLDPDHSRVGQTIKDVEVLGALDDIDECLKRHVIDEVIIAIPRSMLEDAEPIVLACEEEGIRLRFMADIFNVRVAKISLTVIGQLPLLTLESVAQDSTQLLIKRIFDFTLTLLAMPVVLPILAIAAIAIKLDSPGPIFFVQQRVGLKKRYFSMFKLRSMYIDAEDKLKEIEHLNEADGPIFKMKNDPRITRVGRFIRKTSIDELPQFFNVLHGEMSLVGPRPMSIRDVDLFDRGIQRRRFSVKPGLTCIWQISGRSNLPFHKWLELDLKYIENWSLWLDLKILLKTPIAVLKSKGAA